MLHLLSQMKGVGMASLLSIGLHGALAWAVLQAPTGWFGAERTFQQEPVAIEILAPERPVIEEVQAVPEPLPPAPNAPAPPPEATSSRRPPPMNPNPSAGPVGPEEPGAGVQMPSTIEVPEITPSEPPSHPSIDPRSEQMRVMLAPSSVARSGYTVTGPGPSRPSGPAGLATGTFAPRTEAEIEHSLQAGLRAEAMTKAHITREPVRPRRQADGSYLWNGPMFAAHIATDGEVTFEDEADVNTNGFSASGSFDIQGALMGAAGQDPRAAERERFMRETRQLREEIEDRHRADVLRRAAIRMTGLMRRTWGRTDRSEAARRRRIFSLWDETAEDGSMGPVREAIIAFIRETLPEGSDVAYTAAELTRFNGSRQSRERFAPY